MLKNDSPIFRGLLILNGIEVIAGVYSRQKLYLASRWNGFAILSRSIIPTCNLYIMNKREISTLGIVNRLKRYLSGWAERKEGAGENFREAVEKFHSTRLEDS